MAEKTVLTARQKKAIAALVTSRNAREAALAAGVAERTLYPLDG